jgi:polyribonucleotide nucleotidyltransferase
MMETIAVPVAELSPYAPRAAVMTIETAKIREVIGTGGKTIRKIIEETGADIDIHEDGMVFISSPDAAGAAQAQQIIADIVRDIAVGEVYDGTVTRLMDFGVFVKLLPGREGLCHISQLADHRVAKVEDVVQPGDRLRVKVVEIDSKGRINLSHKALL